MIPDEIVEQVQNAADIVAIIGEHVKLKRVGSVFRGPCPFHQGTNANFSVVPGKGYNCFVCHEKGSVFTFVQKRLGLSFVEAVKYVGEKSGVEVKEVQRKREGPDPREPYWELNATVSAWFTQMLWESPGGERARHYLAGRGVSRDVADKFGLGYAPAEFGLMRAYLNGLGFGDDRLIEGGLLVKREEQEEPRPRFRDRLIFPILDASSRTVGFGGRLMGPGEPKYLNSPEGPVYSKGRLLYHFHAARHAIRRAERVILVEGYFDALRVATAGLEEVVAPLGTALTDDQADLIARSAHTAFLLYDSDAPGQKASFRAADVLLARGLTVRMVTLPDGEDPDTFVAKHGGAALEKLLEQALDVFDRKIQLLERGGWFADLQRKRRALDRLLPTIRSTTDSITRDLYLNRAAQAAGIAREVLARELEQVPRRTRTSQRTPVTAMRASAGGPPPPDEPPEEMEEAGHAPDSSAEREIIRVMVLNPDLVEQVVEEVSRLEMEGESEPEMDIPESRGAIRDPVYAAIFRSLANRGAGAEEPDEGLGPLEHRVLEQIRAEPGAVADAGKSIRDALRVLRERALRDKLEQHVRTLGLVADEREKAALLEQGKHLRSELLAVSKNVWRVGVR